MVKFHGRETAATEIQESFYQGSSRGRNRDAGLERTPPHATEPRSLPFLLSPAAGSELRQA